MGMGEPTTIEERVRRGATLLDREKPGWAEQINEAELVMKSCNDCVLGQVYGDYFVGRRTLGLVNPTSSDWGHKKTAAHGFYANEVLELAATTFEEAEAIAKADYDALATAWRAEIRARLQPETLVEDLALAAPVNYIESFP
jgi:hypothetical protein